MKTREASQELKKTRATKKQLNYKIIEKTE